MEGFGRARDLPSVNAVRNSVTASALLERFGLLASINCVYAVLDDVRGEIRPCVPSIFNADDVAVHIEAQACRLLRAVAAALGADFIVSVYRCRRQVGSGALPLDTIASAGSAIRSQTGRGALKRPAASLRGLTRPVIGRVEGGARDVVP
jgi:hypothetical protein